MLLTAFILLLKKCEDNYIGKIDGENFILAENRFIHRNEIKIEEHLNKNNIGRVVVLLESPHKDEFLKNFIAPALGKTGNRLACYLSVLLKKNKYINKDDELFLVNAIQYRCSLGYPTSCVKSCVFNYLFEREDVKNDSIERIHKINPNII